VIILLAIPAIQKISGNYQKEDAFAMMACMMMQLINYVNCVHLHA